MRNTFIIIGMLLSGNSQAQDIPSVKQLQDSTTAGLNRLAYGIMHTAIDSIDAAIPTMEEYMDLFRNKTTRETAVKAYDKWKVFSALSAAYAARNNYKVEELLEFVNEYYKNSEKPKFEDYFNVVEPALYYFSQRQNTDIFTHMAENLYNEAVSRNEDSFLMMVCLYTKAMAAIATGDKASAMTWLEKGHETGKRFEKEERGKRLYKYYVDLLVQQAQGYYYFSDFTNALSTIDEAQECAETFYKKATQPYLTILLIKADVLSRMGKQQKIESTLSEIDSIKKQANNIDPNFMAYIDGLLAAYRKSAKPTDEPSATNADIAYNEALTAMNSGNTKEALQKFSLTRHLLDKCPTSFITSNIQPVNDLVKQYSDMLISEHRLTEAADFLNWAEKKMAVYFPQDKTALRFVYMAYSNMYGMLNDRTKALNYANKAKEMFEQRGEKGLQYLNCLGVIYDIYYATGDYAYCKLFADEINSRMQDILKSRHNETSNEDKNTLYRLTATMYASIGYKTDARKLYDELMKDNRYTKGLPWDDTRKIWALLTMAEDKDKAIEIMESSKAICVSEAVKTFFTCMLAACHASLQSPKAMQYVEEQNDYLKGVTDRTLPTLDANARQMFWGSVKNNLAQLNNYVLGKLNDNTAMTGIAYDNALYVKGTQSKTTAGTPTWKDVRSSLNGGEVAIEFLYVPTDNTPHYAALILRRDYEHPQYVALCSTDSIEQMFTDVQHTDVKRINGMYSIGNTRLYDLIWTGIEPYVKAGDIIYFAPTSVLSWTNLEAVSNGKKRLGSLYKLKKVSSTAEIGRLKRDRWQCDGSVAVYGGIDYEASTHDTTAETVRHDTSDGNTALLSDESFARRNRGAVANDLPGTLAEAQYIEKAFRKHGNNVTPYSAADASEESVKALGGNAPQILHIGTHGFFLYTDNDQKEHRDIIESFETVGNNQQNALLRCGLFFAGANRAWRGERVPDNTENGILTAYELSQIDLTGCRLAVLSACETGLGLVEQYEGVFGLIKAMKLAGVNTVVASLWQVDDKVTMEIMTSFYNNIIAGMTPDEALASAKRDIIKTHPDPYYWAGFFVID